MRVRSITDARGSCFTAAASPRGALEGHRSRLTTADLLAQAQERAGGADIKAGGGAGSAIAALRDALATGPGDWGWSRKRWTRRRPISPLRRRVKSTKMEVSRCGPASAVRQERTLDNLLFRDIHAATQTGCRLALACPA